MLKFIFTSEGRIAYNATNDEYEFIYDVKDYLGNTRVSFKPTAAGNEIMQEDHYYPFGMKMAGLSRVTGSPETKFTYNGKELEDDFNLNWYHYGARYYDPQLGRWQQVDPVDEFHSPYVYVGNNPVMFIDPDGEKVSPVEFVAGSQCNTSETINGADDLNGFENGAFLWAHGLKASAQTGYIDQLTKYNANPSRANYLKARELQSNKAEMADASADLLEAETKTAETLIDLVDPGPSTNSVWEDISSMIMELYMLWWDPTDIDTEDLSGEQ